jgi:NarL family two-component system response regulator LiaR
MDLRLPDIDGIEATRRIKRVSPGTTVVMLTMFDNPELLAEAISAGAAGVLLKAASETALRAAILDAVDGNGGVEAPRAEAPAQTGLSAREQQVLDLVARGYTNRQIAVRLVITASTVKVHVEHILSKLGVADRTQAAVHALTRGYLTPGYGRSPSPRASRTPAGNRGAY